MLVRKYDLHFCECERKCLLYPKNSKIPLPTSFLQRKGIHLNQQMYDLSKNPDPNSKGNFFTCVVLSEESYLTGWIFLIPFLTEVTDF